MRVPHPLLACSLALSATAAIVAGCGTTTPGTATTTTPVPDALVGKPLAVRAADLRGDGVVDLAALRGKVVIVDFWASWCVPCRQAVPFYQRLFTTHEKDGLRVLGVSIDVERALAERFLAEVPTTFTMAWDADQQLAARLQLDTMPTAMIIDRAGLVRAVHRGFVVEDQPGLEALIGRLLAEPAPAVAAGPG
ncbi:MAG: TlpA family protein disulfide reductase [Deltaproteobacteria bacterium]|nr:TlpA family protein disulfide reductase [Deltaproteobacteria bacterium]